MTTNEFTLQFAIRLPDGNLWLSPLSGAVVTWSDRPGAEHVLEQLKIQAASIGLGFLGTIVYRYCTPFIDETANGSGLVDELTAWLQRETGGNR